MYFSKIAFTCFILFTISFAAFADSDNLPKGEKDAKENVVFSSIIENLPLNQAEIYTAALDYLKNEYKTAQYSDIKEFADKGIAVGSSNLNSFYTASGLLSSEVFSADYYLRFDCKENKVRVQVIFTDYQLMKLNDNGNKETVNVKISSVSPFSESKNKKHYSNAYGQLQEFVGRVLSSVTQALKSASPVPEVEEW